MMSKDSGRDYLCFTALEQGTFTFVIINQVKKSRYNHISYSIDGGKTWVTAYNVDNTAVRLTTPIIKPGGRVLWKGQGTGTTASTIVSTKANSRFISTCRFIASGNILSILKENDFENTTSVAINCFGYLFYLSKIVKASIFPKVRLQANSYAYMFCDCVNLLEVSELPSTSLSSTCYKYMFKGCTSLIKAPTLPATNVVSGCYLYMFNNCTSLITAPSLPATELVSNCYKGMFDGCTSLSHVKAMFTTEPSDDYTLDWLNGVAANGTFVKNSAAEWTNRGTNAVPDNWTIQTANE